MNQDVRFVYLFLILVGILLAVFIALPIIIAIIAIVAYAFVYTVAGIIVCFGILIVIVVWGAFAETRHPTPKTPLPNKKK